jgi:anti-anti-sigma factor
LFDRTYGVAGLKRSDRQRAPGGRAMSSFSIDGYRDGDAHVMAISGEVAIERADDLASGLLITRFLDGDRLVIDLADVYFMDSTGLGALLQIRNTVARDGRRMDYAESTRGCGRSFR